VGRAQDISQVLVSEEVRRIRREGWSGVLALTQGEVAKGLYFVDGEIAFAASTVEEDRLGANLYRIGRITEAQFRKGMAVAQTPGHRLGQALIEAGVLTPTELAAAVTGQVERIVLSVFRWSSGRMQRRGMDRPLPADLVLDLSTPRLLLLGAREILNPGRLGPVLGDGDRRLRRVARTSFDYEELPVSPPERAVLALAVRETTLEEVLRLPHPRAQLVRAAYALVVGGMLELLEPEPKAEPAAATPEPPASVTPPPPVSVTPPPPVSVTPAPPEPATPQAPEPVSPSTPEPPPPSAAAVPRRGPDDTLQARDRPGGTVSPLVPESRRPGHTTRPMAAVDPDLLTPTPPPDSELPDEGATSVDADSTGDSGVPLAPAPPTEIPSDPEAGERRARALLENGMREPAVEILEAILESHPGAHAARRLLAMTLAPSGPFDRTVEQHLLKVIEADRGDVEARYRLATYYRRAGMNARAVLQLRLVLSADPGHAAAWRDLGELDAGEGGRGR
jgi:hypothetical protein